MCLNITVVYFWMLYSMPSSIFMLAIFFVALHLLLFGAGQIHVLWTVLYILKHRVQTALDWGLLRLSCMHFPCSRHVPVQQERRDFSLDLSFLAQSSNPWPHSLLLSVAGLLWLDARDPLTEDGCHPTKQRQAEEAWEEAEMYHFVMCDWRVHVKEVRDWVTAAAGWDCEHWSSLHHNSHIMYPGSASTACAIILLNPPSVLCGHPIHEVLGAVWDFEHWSSLHQNKCVVMFSQGALQQLAPSLPVNPASVLCGHPSRVTLGAAWDSGRWSLLRQIKCIVRPRNLTTACLAIVFNPFLYLVLGSRPCFVGCRLTDCPFWEGCSTPLGGWLFPDSKVVPTERGMRELSVCTLSAHEVFIFAYEFFLFCKSLASVLDVWVYTKWASQIFF